MSGVFVVLWFVLLLILLVSFEFFLLYFNLIYHFNFSSIMALYPKHNLEN
jgi:hypothetical protein